MANQRQHILLVDDNLTTIGLNKMLFAKVDNSVEVTTAPDGKAALNILQDLIQEGKDFPDVILVDLKMPVMDGIEFYRQFKLQFSPDLISNTKVIMLTTSMANVDLQRANEEGIDLYLNKPLTLDKIQATILTFE